LFPANLSKIAKIFYIQGIIDCVKLRGDDYFLVRRVALNMKYKVLVADSDSVMRETLVNYLEEFFEVIATNSSEEALSLFNSQQIDLVLLDVVMPNIDGFELIKEIRKVSQVPIMVLTSRLNIEEQLKAYDLGVDDYLLKPCDIKLVIAKIKRLLFRVYDETAMNQTLAFDKLVVNKLARTVRIDNKLVTFRPKEFDLLVFLIENEGIALDRDRILDAVWGIDYFGDTRVVDSHIKKIRKKLDVYAKCIHTIFGIGYKFELV